MSRENLLLSRIHRRIRIDTLRDIKRGKGIPFKDILFEIEYQAEREKALTGGIQFKAITARYLRMAMARYLWKFRQRKAWRESVGYNLESVYCLLSELGGKQINSRTIKHF